MYRYYSSAVTSDVQRKSQKISNHLMYMNTLQNTGRRCCCNTVSFFTGSPSNSNYHRRFSFLDRRTPTSRVLWKARSFCDVTSQDSVLATPQSSAREMKNRRRTSDFTNKMRHSTQQSDENIQREMIQMAQTLLDLKKFPIGTFTSTEYSKIKVILYYYIHFEKPTWKEAVNNPIDIIVRLAQEVAYIISINDSTGASNNIKRELGDHISSKKIRNTLAATSNPLTYEWILNANYFNPIFTTWKNLSINAQDRIPGIYSGLDLVQKLHYMSKILPPTIYKVNIITVTMVLQVVMKQVRRDEAPIICEKVLHIMSQQLQKQKEMADAANSVRLQRELKLFEPNIFSYNILLKAWAESRLDNATEKIEKILQEIENNPNTEIGLVSYKILLRFYSRMGDVDNVNIVLQQMHVKKLPIGVDCLTQALNCCCRAGQMDNAYTILNMIIHQHPNTAERTKAIQDSIHHLIAAYRTRLEKAFIEEATVQKTEGDDCSNVSHDDGTSPDINVSDSGNNDKESNFKNEEATHRPAVADVVQNTIQRLQDLTNIVKTNNVLNHHSIDYFFQMLLELYVQAKLLTTARELIKKELPRSVEAYCVLLKAYCDQNQVQVATRLLYDLLQNNEHHDATTGILPNTQMFNIVIEGWCKSKNINDAYGQVSILFETLRNYPKCHQYKIRPNHYTYVVLLESLLSLNVPNGAIKAEAILDEMEETYNRAFFSDNPNNVVDVNDLVKPDVDIYMLVMKAWIQSNDSDRAMTIIRRMEKTTNIVPDKQMYYDLLGYYVKVGGEKAAESAEQMFKLMKASYEPQYHAYCMLNRVWLKSGSPKAADKLWLLFREMTELNMRPDQPLYLQLIQLLVSKNELSYVRKAQMIVDDIEDRNSKYLVPTHYTMMIIAYLELDEMDFALQVLSKFVDKFGQRDNQLVPIMTQLIKVWIEKGEYKKATVLVNSMQEFRDAGLLQQSVKSDLFELLKSAWESSVDPDKDFIIEQIDDILLHLSRDTAASATVAATTTANENDTVRVH